MSRTHSPTPEVTFFTGRYKSYPATRAYFNRAAIDFMGIQKGYKAVVELKDELIIGVGLPDFTGKSLTYQQNSKQEDVLTLMSIKLALNYNIPSGVYEVSEPFMGENEELAYFKLTPKT